MSKKAQRVNAECIVRGFLLGSAWRDYKKTGTICGFPLPEGLKKGERLPEPLFTPSTKADKGHDENISYQQLEDLLGSHMAHRLKEISLKIYTQAYEYAYSQGLVLCDTKFEFGLVDSQLIIIDELLTPDSSRFLRLEDYQAGAIDESYDKEIIRQYLLQTNWDKTPPAPQLPEELIEKTCSRYSEIKKKLIS